MDEILQTRGLTKTYGRNGRGVRDVDLEMRDTEVFGMLGPYVAGKNTTVRTLWEFVRHTSG